MDKKIISIVTPCFNEQDGIFDCYNAVKKLFETSLLNYSYEHIFIDNCSKDRTVEILKKIALTDKKVKIIVNSRNFGLANSPYHAKLQASGDAIIPLVADLQTPVEIIPEMIQKWEDGAKMVLGIRKSSKTSLINRLYQKFFYKVMVALSGIEQYPEFIGFGVFDRKVMNVLRNLNEPTPYFRGLVSEIGFKKEFVYYDEPKRKYGKSRHSFFDLLNLAILGVISCSTLPLRFVTILGITTALSSFIAGIFYMLKKLIYWDSFELGIAPLLISILFLFSVTLTVLGVIGEYIAVTLKKVSNRPLVIEDERVNFDE